MKLYKSGISHSAIGEWCFILLTLALVIINFAGANDTHFRIIAVFILGSGYLQFILYMRLFDSTAVLVSMIYYICSEILVFLIVFIVAIIAFANMFFVMQGVSKNLGYDEDSANTVGSNFALACLSAFNAAFGSFSVENFSNYGPYEWVLWLIFVTLVLIL